MAVNRQLTAELAAISSSLGKPMFELQNVGWARASSGKRSSVCQGKKQKIPALVGLSLIFVGGRVSAVYEDNRFEQPIYYRCLIYSWLVFL